MTREIKFRAWNPDKKKWVKEFCLMSEGDFGRMDDTNPLTVQVMQFTGLRDKNGKEIYEGDIVSVPTAAGPIPSDIRWNLQDGAWEAVADQHECVYLGDEISGCEVIGNIHENPELLK